MYAYCIGRPLEMWLSVGTSFSIISERQKTRKKRNNNGLYGCENGGQFLPRTFCVVDEEQTRYQCKQIHALKGTEEPEKLRIQVINVTTLITTPRLLELGTPSITKTNMLGRALCGARQVSFRSNLQFCWGNQCQCYTDWQALFSYHTMRELFHFYDGKAHCHKIVLCC